MKFIFRMAGKLLKYLSFSVFCFFLLSFCLIYTARNTKYRFCAELPNGLRIGREALFDPRKYLWTPNVVVKLPDGTTLVPGGSHSFYFSETTVYGDVNRPGIVGGDLV